ncbi:hypothetical protein NPIL_360501 [Nephila pilipes]|uniref:Copia protein n=1 Tax=Nephila pilipes TaxID=299642 RepID=A0A8X6QTR7_NEPPI|nr:hypothetical protein NPIL_360501 [Nephila pilipes]
MAVNKRSRENENPTEKDWAELKKLMLFLNATKDINLVINSMSLIVLITAAQTTQEIQWLILLLKDRLEQHQPIRLLEDKSYIIVAQTTKSDSRIKHIDANYHYLRQLNTNGTIQYEYCDSK